VAGALCYGDLIESKAFSQMLGINRTCNLKQNPCRTAIKAKKFPFPILLRLTVLEYLIARRSDYLPEGDAGLLAARKTNGQPFIEARIVPRSSMPSPSTFQQPNIWKWLT